MAARGADALRRRCQDPDVHQPVARRITFDNLTGKHLRHKNLTFRSLRNAVAAVAKPVNGQDHSAASLSSTPMKPPDWRLQ